MVAAPALRQDYQHAPALYRHIARLCLDDALVCRNWRLAFIQPRHRYTGRFYAYYVLFNGRLPVGKVVWCADTLRETHWLLADVLCEVGVGDTARFVIAGAWRLSHTLEDYRRVPVLK